MTRITSGSRPIISPPRLPLLHPLAVAAVDIDNDDVVGGDVNDDVDVIVRLT